MQSIVIALMPRPIVLTLNLSSADSPLKPGLFGHDLEFTRHDLFSGLASEILANRKFAALAPCSGATPPSYSCWPAPVQQMASEGLIPRWKAIGAASLDVPYWSAHSALVTGDLGHSVHCPANDDDETCGVSQGTEAGGFDAGMSFGSAIVLKAAAGYNLRLVLRGGSVRPPAYIAASLSDASGALWSTHVPLNETSTSRAAAITSAWKTVELPLTPPRTTLNATLTIQSAPGGGEWWLGSASLTPSSPSRTWRGGLRRDVVDAMKATGFKGLLRYPGGCFAPFYRWKVGLLDPDLRPPLATPPGYCAAVSGGVNAYTDGFVQNGIGIDDYLALCEEVGLIPAITVRLQTADEEELKEAEEWVEYCNGDAATTKGGKLRASRGHPAPYNVTYWYLGNEISQQLRYPNYPNDLKGRPPPSAKEYAAMLSRLVPRMVAASPNLPLRLLTVASGNSYWNQEWVQAVGAHVFATSFHAGYYNEPASPFTAAAASACALYPSTGFTSALQGLREELGQLQPSNASSIAISADEWGLGPPWLVRNFSVTHAIYAAAFLSTIVSKALPLNVQMSNYFEPVNEGAVSVGPFDATLTPVGQVMKLYARHQLGRRVPGTTGGDDHQCKGAAALNVSVANSDCQGLIRHDGAPSQSAAACEAACCADSTCSVFQFCATGGQCTGATGSAAQCWMGAFNQCVPGGRHGWDGKGGDPARRNSIAPLDATATVADSSDEEGHAADVQGGSTLTLTVAHLNASAWYPRALTVDLVGAGGAVAAGAAVEVELLRADGFNESSRFVVEHSTVQPVAGGKQIHVSVPPFSVMQLRVALRSARQERQ